MNLSSDSHKVLEIKAQLLEREFPHDGGEGKGPRAMPQTFKIKIDLRGFFQKKNKTKHDFDLILTGSSL